MTEVKLVVSDGDAKEQKSSDSPIATAGDAKDSVNARFSNQFLALLSDHLYSSPNKAFEELVTNSWDAGASNVYVKIPEVLDDETSAIWILDDGLSMDVSGFEALWNIAESKKRENGGVSPRKQIGKFGIGKLATYILCNELTYVCKASDGVIRIVTMDYRRIDEAKNAHLEQIPLDVREISEKDLHDLLKQYDFGQEISDLISNGVPNIKNDDAWEDEYGGKHEEVEKAGDTWTLAILSSLKEEGVSIQTGWVKFLLSTALPMGSSMSIDINGKLLAPSKANKTIQKEWVIGPDLGVTELEMEDGTTIDVTSNDKPYPSIHVEGLGEVTGKVRFYEDNITGGKSEDIALSNGFFLNVLGRVINLENDIFKLEHLNHSVLARFRATVRIDELDKLIAANRESIAEGKDLRIVRVLLRKLFNLARREYNKLSDVKYDDASKGIKDQISDIPVGVLDDAIQTSIENNDPLPPFIDANSIEDEETERAAWVKATKEDLSKTIEKVHFEEKSPHEPHVKYDLKSRSVSINKNHPFVKENSQTSEQTNTMRDTAIVDLLTDAYMLNCGINEDLLDDISLYRDRALRLMAQVRRNSASQIIATLGSWDSDATPFEHIVGDALEYIGFSVDRYGASGEPEGVATAFVSPKEDDQKATYSFTYDAKSTKHKRAKTGNLNISGLARHREDYEADYSLVVAPGFQAGAVVTEAEANGVTPMRAKDLAKLVSITVSYGPVSLVKLQELFSLSDPDKVTKWIDQLENEMAEEKIVDLLTIVEALEGLVTKDKIDILSCDVIAHKCREILNKDTHPTRSEIAQSLRGLSLFAPSVLYMDQKTGKDVFVLSNPKMLLQEIRRQTDIVPEEFKYGVLKDSAESSDL